MLKKKEIEWYLEYWRKKVEENERDYENKKKSFELYLHDRAFYDGQVFAFETVLCVEK